MDDTRDKVSKAQRIVLKIGTSLLTRGKPELDSHVFDWLAGEIARLEKDNNRQFVIVSSGAIAAGRPLLIQKKAGALTIPQKQAAAAIGQGRLIHRYQESFASQGRTIAQILLTHGDLADRPRYLNARHTLLTLLQNNVIPVINENDSVTVEEIKLGDNDNLSAIIASLVDADLLILLTDQDGIFDRNPTKHKGAKLIPLVKSFEEKNWTTVTREAGVDGVGGMATKIEAAKRAALHGIPTVIANGGDAKVLRQLLAGDEIGTLCLPHKDHLKSRKHWIGHTLRPKGEITVDEGAKRALMKDGKSLLPSGIIKIKGEFKTGDPVALRDEKGRQPFAQGLTSYDSRELEKIKGKKTSEIEEILGYKIYDEVIHRDDLVILKP